jgi:dipeptidyl-peptidase-4
VDNRGTGGRGEEFKKMTYQQLGKYETNDQVGAARYFGDQPFIDKSRIGIWGWSYGGYMSSLCISKGADVFKAAVAVAPVTNWRYYDNIYTERFMRTPAENPAGYDDNSPINHVSKIKGNYLIIHGTADDNVHFQNTVEMVDAMIEAGVKFDSEIYPNKAHGIGGKRTQYHLFSRISSFLAEKL